MQLEKSRKTPVFWTQHEETMVAIEVHRMRAGESEMTSNGRYAGTLKSQLALAQKRVLPPERRLTDSAFYYKGKKRNFDEAWYQHALSRRALYEPAKTTPPDDALPATPPVEEAPEDPVETSEPDPEMEATLILGSLVQQLVGYLGRAITKGVRDALVELRDEEERRLRANGDHITPPPPIPTSAREIVRRKIDVIGLKPVQRRIVEASPVARTWDIRFLESGTNHARADLRERVIICTKWVPHHLQNRYKQMKANIHWANGGALSVIEQLEHLSRRAPNGSGAVH